MQNTIYGLRHETISVCPKLWPLRPVWLMSGTFWGLVITTWWNVTFDSISMFNWKVNVQKKKKQNTSPVIWASLSQHYIHIFCWLCAWTMSLIRTSESWTHFFCVLCFSAVLFLICYALFLVCNLHFFDLFWQASSGRICVLRFTFLPIVKTFHFFILMQNTTTYFLQDASQLKNPTTAFKAVLYNCVECFHMISLNAEVILVNPHWVTNAVVSICLCALTNKKQGAMR